MEINTNHIKDVPLEKWQEVCTNLKIGIAKIMDELQKQKTKIEDDKELSEEERFEKSFTIFIQQGTLGTFLEDLLFFYCNEQEKKFNSACKNNIDLLNETLEEIGACKNNIDLLNETLEEIEKE